MMNIEMQKDLIYESENRSDISVIRNTVQFKGNMVHVGITNGDNITNGERNTIYIVNKYYAGFARQEYDINKKETLLKYSIQQISPKWLAKLLTHQIYHIPINLNNGVICNFDQWNSTIEYTITKPGLNFRTNVHNIAQLKELQYIFNSIKNSFKGVSSQDIPNIIIDLESVYNNTMKLIDGVLQGELYNERNLASIERRLKKTIKTEKQIALDLKWKNTHN